MKVSLWCGLCISKLFFISFLVLDVSAQKLTMFEPESGNWSDEANWTNGVAKESTDIAQIKVGVRHITNDLPQVTISRVAIQTENNKEIHFWGNPISAASYGFGSRNVYFHNAMIHTDWLKNVDGTLYFCGVSNQISQFMGNRDFHFVPPAGMGVVTNPTLSGKPILKYVVQSGNPSARLYLDAEEGSYPVQEIDLYQTYQDIGVLIPNARSTFRISVPSVVGMLANNGAGTVTLDPSPKKIDSVAQKSSGSIAFAAPDLGVTAPAPGALVHLDASDPAAFVFQDDDPAKGVIRWNGVRGAGYAYHDGCVALDGTQVLPTRQENVVNGKAIVDFGPWNKAYGDAKNRAKGGYLILKCGPNTDYQIYTAFVVESCQNFVFCSTASGDGDIFHGGDNWTQNIVTTRNETHIDFRDPKNISYPGTGLGLLHFNGEKRDAWNCRLSGQGFFDSIGVRAESRPIKIARLAWDRSYRTGAAKIAEIILYERKLTDAEFSRTETYLRNKWQNAGAEWTPPAVHHQVGTLVSRANAPFAIEKGSVVSADRLDINGNSGVRRITGGGKLNLSRVTDTLQNADKPLTIQHATIALSSKGKVLQAPVVSPITNCMNHLDASVSNSFVFAEDGTSVLEWRDLNYEVNGFAACYAGEASGNLKPKRVEGILNGLAGVDFGRNNSKMCLLWNKTNTTMRTIFMVYAGPREGYNFLLGDTFRNNQADFHTGDNTMFFPYGYTAEAIKSADLRVNGEKVSWNGHYLPNEPCVVMIASTQTNLCMSAAAFAVDRWGHPSNGNNFRTGGQQICEAVFYDRILDVQEREDVQNWLMKKWLARKPAGYALESGEEQVDRIVSQAASGEKAVVEVASDEVVSVGALSGSSIAKDGDGKLIVGSLADLNGTLSLQAGTISIAARDLPADWQPPLGYRADGGAASDARALFLVLDQEQGTIPLPTVKRTGWDMLRIDGVLQAASSTAYPGGVHVVSLMLSERQAVSAWAPGTEVKEQLVYQRPITDLERRDIEAYLLRKWTGTVPYGYRGANVTVGSISAEGGRLLAEDSSALLSIWRIQGNEEFLISGTVQVGDAQSLQKSIRVGAGSTLRFSPNVAALEGDIPMDGLIARFDMSHPETLETEMVNGTNFVTRWRDLSGKHVATADSVQRPWILPGDCNGLDVLCTGPFCSTTLNPDNKTLAGWMTWDQSDCHARTVIEVIGVQEGGSFVVCGSEKNGGHVVHRGNSGGVSYLDPLLASGREEPTDSLYGPGAYFAINGEEVDRFKTPFPSPSYHSVTVRVDPDFYETSGEQGYFVIGQFGKERWYRWGGQRVCEVIAYDRLLTDEEVGILEAYLQKKWFNRVYRNYGSPLVNDLYVEKDGVVDLNGDLRTFATVGGAGTIRGGILNVSEVFAPAGLNVQGTLNFVGSEGTIRLPVDQPPNSGTTFDLGSVAQMTGDWKSWKMEPLQPTQQVSLNIVDGRLYATVYGAGSLLILR